MFIAKSMTAPIIMQPIECVQPIVQPIEHVQPLSKKKKKFENLNWSSYEIFVLTFKFCHLWNNPE